ncbi:MAG TPA: glucosamine-6-phosphate deaminase [Candidatus Sulfotelmatobacter sp.]|nr:glucosamine-6-phosphate deaminase [Candidatus Sulfotelmatobacter sp.]
MLVRLFKDSDSLGQAAAEQAADCIRRAIAERGCCRVVLATGNSQLAFLNALIRISGIEWKKVEAFHLDEYVGMPATHPASFRKFLLERVIRKTGIAHFHGVEGDATDLPGAIARIGRELTSAPIDLAFIGIGENGHVAFNDPPADFETEDPYIVVALDEPCRRQQVGEGWFRDISEVPTRAISMSPRQIMKAREIISVVPDKRKASAVRLCVEGEIRPMAPASIMRRHPNVTVYLDENSASLLNSELLGQLRRESRATVGT